MRVVLVNTLESRGGAARAASRLHKGLLSANIDSLYVVQKRDSGLPHVICHRQYGFHFFQPKIDQIPLYLFYSKFRPPFTLNWFPDTLVTRLNALKPDVIHLHWISKGFMRIEAVRKIATPIVWTLHDMWPFTGGCHYSESCSRYQDSCGVCPMLSSQSEHDLSRKVWLRKYKAWKDVNIEIVAPSLWMAECTSKSSLFFGRKIHVIPNGLDLTLYRPVNKLYVRGLLGLSPSASIILFAAANPNNKLKGMAYLVEAIKLIAERWPSNNLEIAVLGAPQGDYPIMLPTHYLGKINEENELALAFSAADVFVAPSLQDNLPNTIMEAMACGVPCVGFSSGGIPEMIDHKENGYLASTLDIEDLARGIMWILEDENRRTSLGRNARAKAEREYNMHIQASRYKNLYQDLMSKDRK